MQKYQMYFNMQIYSKLYLLCLLFMWWACTTGTDEYLAGRHQKVAYPPSMVKISDNFFADKTEVTNLDYREILLMNGPVNKFSINEFYSCNALIF